MEVVPLFQKIYGEGRPLIILHGTGWAKLDYARQIIGR